MSAAERRGLPSSQLPQGDGSSALCMACWGPDNSHAGSFIRQSFHDRGSKLRRPEGTASPTPSNTQLLKEECHSDRRVPLSPHPAPEPWLRYLAQGERETINTEFQNLSQKHRIRLQHSLGNLKLKDTLKTNKYCSEKQLRGDQGVRLTFKRNHKLTSLSERTREGDR